MQNSIEIYLSGKRLYGDDFDSDHIESWYKDEIEGYANLGDRNRASYKYVYHSLNQRHGFKYIVKNKNNSVLGIGSAHGDEFLPIIGLIDRITIIDPSEAFITDNVHGVPCDYIKPSIDGKIPFNDSVFDIIVSLGVLHHIPNVSYVIREFYRCLKNNGVALLREPIVSMGDWSKNRRGLTKRERGIPLDIFQNIISKAGFGICHKSLCIFPLISKIFHCMGVSAYNNNIVTWMDAKLSKLFSWNVCYHSTALIKKLRPTSAYFVIRK